MKDLIQKYRSATSLDEALQLILELQQQYNQHNGIQKTVRLTKKDLTFFLYAQASKLYKEFHIPKKSGGQRTILSPIPKLKLLQRYLAFLFDHIFRPKAVATGFVRGKSIIHNAQAHVDKKYVLNVDLENFFPSIYFSRIQSVLQNKSFGFSKAFSKIIANLCCHQGKLPQGAPTSPILSNIVCQWLDSNLVKLAKKYRSRVSRYADDITFSSHYRVYSSKFFRELKQCVEQQGFKINPQKTRIQHKNQRQTVTGITVNEKVNLPRTYIREVRALLHNWKTKGYANANSTFLIKKNKPSSNPDALLNYLQGKIAYLKIIRSPEDHLYLKYLQEFRELQSVQNQHLKTQIPKQEAFTNRTLLELLEHNCGPQGKTLLTYLNEINHSDYFVVYKKYNFPDLKAFHKELRELMNFCKSKLPKSALKDLKKAETTVKRNLHNLGVGHFPQKTSNFFNQLKQEGNVLKYFVHPPYEQHYDLTTYSRELEQFKQLLNDHSTRAILPYNLYAIFWRLYGLYTNKEIKEWISSQQKHPLFKPEFKQKIDLFKQKYRFEERGPLSSATSFVDSIKKILQEKEIAYTTNYHQFQIDIEELTTFSTETDVTHILNGIRHLLKSMLEYTKSKKIQLSHDYDIKNEVDIIRIVQEGQEATKNPQKIRDRIQKLQGDLAEVLINPFSKNGGFLFSRCDWQMEFQYKGKSYRLDILRNGCIVKPFMKNKLDVQLEEISTKAITGFTHKLIFYVPE